MAVEGVRDTACSITAGDMARWLSVDLKTIHNWADRGQIPHFRTPGRHLRFRRPHVLDFLRKYGCPIPEELESERPRVALLVDGLAGQQTQIIINSLLAPDDTPRLMIPRLAQE